MGILHVWQCELLSPGVKAVGSVAIFTWSWGQSLGRAPLRQQ